MKMTSSWYLRIGLGVLCVVIILEGALMWANIRTRRHAEALLASLQALKIGTSIEEVAGGPLLTGTYLGLRKNWGAPLLRFLEKWEMKTPTRSSSANFHLQH